MGGILRKDAPTEMSKFEQIREKLKEAVDPRTYLRAEIDDEEILKELATSELVDWKSFVGTPDKYYVFYSDTNRKKGFYLPMYYSEQRPNEFVVAKWNPSKTPKENIQKFVDRVKKKKHKVLLNTQAWNVKEIRLLPYWAPDNDETEYDRKFRRGKETDPDDVPSSYYEEKKEMEEEKEEDEEGEEEEDEKENIDIHFLRGKETLGYSWKRIRNLRKRVKDQVNPTQKDQEIDEVMEHYFKIYPNRGLVEYYGL